MTEIPAGIGRIRFPLYYLSQVDDRLIRLPCVVQKIVAETVSLS